MANVYAPFPPHKGTFIVKNIAANRKTLSIFQYPIHYNKTRDLLGIPGVSESDIRASLLKGELLHKILAHEITINDSDIDLLQFNDEQKAFLQQAGVIKGLEVTSSESSAFFYQRADAIDIDLQTDFENISNKTLDAKVQITDQKLSGITVPVGSNYISITDVGNLRHSTMTNLTGVPLFDNFAYTGDYRSCYVEIVNRSRSSSIESLSDSSKRIFGLTREGSSVSPNSIEIEFRIVTRGEELSTSTPYTWETGQIDTVDMYYGFGVRKDLLDPATERFILSEGIVGNSGAINFNRIVFEINGTLVYSNDEIVLKL